MSASDEVAALPGGQALAALAAQVRGNPGAIREIANSWREAAGDCSGHARAVHTAVTEVRQDWKGSSADSFGALMGRFATAGARARQALRSAATALDGAAGALESAQRSVEGICENLLAEVSRLRAANPLAASSDLDAAISGLAADATAAARSKVAEAREALDRARGALGGDLAELNQTFSALPQPGSAGFADSWQAPGGWHPAGSAQTTGALSGGPAQSADSGGSPSQADDSGGTGVPPGTGGGVPASSGAGGGAYLTAMDTPGGSGGGAGSFGDGPAPPAQVNGWIDEAVKILEAQGIPASKLSAADIWIIIQHESGGNPSAVNNWDSNAAAGTPSIGIMQTIQPTFNAYALQGHGNIYNPVDNIIAGVRYALARYGSLDNVPGVAAVHNGQPYVGY